MKTDYAMYMIKRILLPLFLFFALPVLAQQRPGAREKIETMKIAYITTAVNLTEAEAQQFWPIYNEAEIKRKELRKSRMSERKEAAQNFETMTDKEAEVFIDKEIEFKQKELDIQKDLHAKLKKVLSAKKIARLYKAETDFQRKVLQELERKRENEASPGR
ncbi:MAG: sensor of ECF-type sigma factor [Bacteroidia bacterium]